jgi:uncharacterized OsmC-like protein
MLKTITINSIWKGKMRVEGEAGTHTMVIDQPEKMGGSDAGPNPLEYFLLALGGCLGTVAAIIARQERIDLRDFSVEIEGDYDVDFLMGKTEEGRAGFTQIREKVFIDADMTDAEKEAFFKKVSARCPVTDSIHYETETTFTIL